MVDHKNLNAIFRTRFFERRKWRLVGDAALCFMFGAALLVLNKYVLPYRSSQTSVPPPVVMVTPPMPADRTLAAKWKTEHDSDRLTLWDLYSFDFGGGIMKAGYSKQLTSHKTGATVALEFFKITDFEKGTHLLEYYLPSTPETYYICAYLADKSEIFIRDAESGLLGGEAAEVVPGNSSHLTNKGTMFSHRVYIYHEAYLGPEQIVSLNKTVQKAWHCGLI